MEYAEQVDVFNRDVPKVHLTLIAVSILFWMGVVAYAYTQAMSRARFGIAFLGGTILILVIRDLGPAIRDRNYLQLALLSVITAGTSVSTVYFFREYLALATVRVGFSTDLDYIMSVPIILIILYLTYREFGILFLSVILFGIFYSYYGWIFPGVFNHTGLSVTRILGGLAVDISGIYGRLNRLVAAWIALFLLYAGLLKGYGAFDLIMRISFSIGKHITSGVAQTAVISSMIIGSLNGSATANTGITGALTIPLMKESGLKGRTAGAIEAVASNGGQLLPPVMGASAFIMASLLGISYFDVVVAGLIPAAIFYITIVVAVHYIAVNEMGEFDIDSKRGEYFDEKLSRGQVAFELLRFLPPMLILVYALGIARWTVQSSALYTCASMVLLGVGMPLISEPTVATVKDGINETLNGFKFGALSLAPIAIIIAGINGLVDVLMISGMPGILTIAIVDLSGGILLLAIIAGICICIILGLGMPTSAAYLIVALLVAPTYISEFGVAELPSHFFVFYSASLATITPPIATGVVVASGIANADFWPTAKKAMQISAHLFFLPVMFIYNPQTISSTLSLNSIFSGLLGLFGAISMIYALNKARPDLRWMTKRPLQISYIILGALMMASPNQYLRVVSLAICLVIFAVEKWHKGISTSQIMGKIRSYQ